MRSLHMTKLIKHCLTPLVLLALVGLSSGPFPNPTHAQRNVKALVGGTLIDGFGSTPIRNSVIIIEGERIKSVGQVGSLAIPTGAEVISTEGMSFFPGCGTCTSTS